ncbi:MAG TPA: formylglycine-generating enzyme family protein [Rhizomicrobium sp.]|jgi:formylglycine-generating enzyme required for sulfatase activity|nr:formylglycine-generating enzyme family protein [Rhizomicrobium sp.]
MNPTRLKRTIWAAVLLVGACFAPAAAQDRKDREFQECRDCPVMVAIPAGRFVMGSPAGEPGRFENEGPQHVVSVRAFALGKYDVTSEEFLTFLRATGYQPKPCNPILQMQWHSPGKGLAWPPYDEEPQLWPAACLDWNDANAYIAWLNREVQSEHPQLAGRAGPYRLPSEAEWEFAARAGTTTARWWGDAVGSGKADCNGCGSHWDDSELSDVDSFAPNPFGLYGMLGNVWQWTADCWHDSYVGAPQDGGPWKSGNCEKHVIRGGSWDNVPIFIRSAARSSSTADGGEYDYSSLSGFRLARSLP